MFRWSGVSSTVDFLRLPRQSLVLQPHVRKQGFLAEHVELLELADPRLESLEHAHDDFDHQALSFVHELVLFVHQRLFLEPQDLLDQVVHQAADAVPDFEDVSRLVDLQKGEFLFGLAQGLVNVGEKAVEELEQGHRNRRADDLVALLENVEGYQQELGLRPGTSRRDL